MILSLYLVKMRGEERWRRKTYPLFPDYVLLVSLASPGIEERGNGTSGTQVGPLYISYYWEYISFNSYEKSPSKLINNKLMPFLSSGRVVYAWPCNIWLTPGPEWMLNTWYIANIAECLHTNTLKYRLKGAHFNRGQMCLGSWQRH